MSFLNKIVDFNYKNNVGLLNMTDEFFALSIKKIFNEEKRAVLVVTSNMLEARNIYNNLLDDTVVLFEDNELTYGNENVVSPELKVDRLNILKDLLKDNKKIVITDIKGLLRKLPSSNDFRHNELKLKTNDLFDRDRILEIINDMGYERVSVVEKMGEYAIRGFVFDIYPVNYDNPIRIEFFGDEIETIKIFDINDQLSVKKIDNIEIIPFTEKISSNSESIYDYLFDPIVIYKDFNQINIAYNNFLFENPEFDSDFYTYYFDFSKFKIKDKMYYFDFDDNIGDISVDDVFDLKTKSVPIFNENFKEINNFINQKIKETKTVILCLDMKNLNAFLDEISFSYVVTNWNNIIDKTANIIKDKLAKGFEKEDFVILTDYELFGRRKIIHKKTKFKYSSKIRNLSKLEIGDYVVHEFHGIGIYNGIKILKKGTILSDYIEILYAKRDKLYVPVSKIEYIGKYNGKDGHVPKINALNSTSWLKSKQRIREKIKIEAEKLIKIQAKRQLEKGFAFSKDTPMQEMFEQEFIYDITPDQEKAIIDIKKDMESKYPMDRILCGDVGYGKTEVAFRAMFKATLDSKQILYLCPTTILCKQQYDVALERFKNYPINIGILNRFISRNKIKSTLSSLKTGKIDILFATHRGLSDDVVFNDLGLLIVDEEQRFGVSQKEKIKELKNNVDVLTLTATPIPRTLQMAIFGIKNLSLIETPPKNRKAVATYVTPFDKKLIREIVYKEVSRGGQVFILYNRVEDMEKKVLLFQRLLPDVKINFAHGKMDSDSFEKVMNDFVLKKFDVLICTTIIETGIDIPNVNSLIIVDADRFGLSQLYQIRGRVGRSDTLAYAYLMYEKGKVITSNAIKRLKVIKDFTELGSGFAIAAKDLSIRGAGDILGNDQAGFIDTVGIDMYIKLLEEELKKQKGEPVEEEKEDDIKLVISSHIKNDYVEEEDVKIEIHKMVNNINSFDSLKEIKQKIEDRFGSIDNDMNVYLHEQLFKSLCKKIGITKIFDNSIYREIIMKDKTDVKIGYDDLFTKSLLINKKFKFSYKNNSIIITLKYKDSLNGHVVFDFNELLKELL